ncbi:hypothetical protein HP550_08315 [Cellulomonas humilata]|uniref:PknH-like extracellular domain-containing protein n=1 Tax=Cellulomonas humilata TaxID=144055 RepID=A0A7Y6A2E9_9CELL|nr:hypothetical protein [Cellulomonas humilata]NUU17254.1 hypothetical protein [Cellulomonas humilata]
MHPARLAAAALAIVVLAGCSADGGSDPAGSASATSTPTRAPLTFEEATAALTGTLLPTAAVTHCDEYEPGSPEAQEYLDKLAEETAASPTLPQCGNPALGDLRAASLAGHAFALGDPVALPFAGGASRAIEVYELRDADSAQTAVATEAADLEGWAADKETPRVDNADGSYMPRTVVSEAGVAEVDLPGWTAWVLSRDEASFQDDGSVAADPYSTALLWAARDSLVIRVQVVGDTPGQAVATALDTATRYVTALD